MLGVLLSTAKQTSGSWLSRLRPDSAVHLVIVTDDDPEAALAATFVQKLTQLAQKRLGSSAAPAFQLHSLLGIALNGPWVLRPDADPQSRGCAVAAGLPYQELSIRTNGLRGSVCFAESFNAFTDELLLRTRSGQPCQMMFPENFPADRLTSIRAISPSGRSDRHLQRAFDADNCHFATPRYLVTRNRLSVCPVTCGALTADGFTEIEAVANCP